MNYGKLPRRLAAYILLALLLLAGGCVREETPPRVVDVGVPTPAPTPTPSPTPSPSPTPEPTPTPDPYIELMAGMSDAELVGQLLMSGIGGEEYVTDSGAKLFSERHVGAALLFGWNVAGFEQGAEIVADVKALSRSRVPLTVAIDVEGGSVYRFDEWSGELPSAKSLGRTGDPQRAYESYYNIGSKLAELGFTVDLAPVADIARDPDASFMGRRIFGSDAELASRMVAEAVRGLDAGGVASCVKHFPGVAETADDPHNVVPEIDMSLDELEDYVFVPFKAAIDAGCQMMMVTHVVIPAIDGDNLASLSREVITGVLRNRLGFDGVIVSDDLRMDAVELTMAEEDAALEFILAGGDMIMSGSVSMTNDVLDRLLEALSAGELTRARVEESVYRIIKMKLG